MATFARRYVKKLGDMNVYSFPHRIDDEFNEEDRFMLRHEGTTGDEAYNVTECEEPTCLCHGLIAEYRESLK